MEATKLKNSGEGEEGGAGVTRLLEYAAMCGSSTAGIHHGTLELILSSQSEQQSDPITAKLAHALGVFALVLCWQQGSVIGGKPGHPGPSESGVCQCSHACA